MGGGRFLSATIQFFQDGQVEVYTPMKVNVIIGLVGVTCLYGCMMGSGDLEHRISRLEQQNSMLEKQAAATASQLREQTNTNDKLLTASAELRATVDELRTNIQSLTGRLEEMDFSIKKGSLSMNDTEKEAIGRLNRIEEVSLANRDRIAKVEQYLDIEVAPQAKEGTSDTGVASAKPTKDQTLSEAELYATGKQAFDDGQYDAAREKFQELISTYPKSKNADNAQFWVGEIYYREKWYEKAIMEYQKVIENYPDGNKVPASLLKQGLSFYNLNEQANARLILQEMINKYPTSNEAKIAREKLKTF